MPDLPETFQTGFSPWAPGSALIVDAAGPDGWVGTSTSPTCGSSRRMTVNGSSPPTSTTPAGNGGPVGVVTNGDVALVQVGWHLDPLRTPLSDHTGQTRVVLRVARTLRR